MTIVLPASILGWFVLPLAVCAVEGQAEPVASLEAGDFQKLMKELSPEAIERLLPQSHPSVYYEYAGWKWKQGRRDEAVFWLYVAQLRYRFHLLANPDLEPSGDPALFGSLQAVIARPINMYAWGDPKKLDQQFEEVLNWDETTPSGFTSKVEHKKELDKTRQGLKGLQDYIRTHADEIRNTREQEGIGEVGVIDGIYVEEVRPKMPKDWPELHAATTPEMIAGVYVSSSTGLLGPILFRGRHADYAEADAIDLSFTGPTVLLVVAKRDDRELGRSTIAVRQEGGAVVFEEHSPAEESGLAEGGDRRTVYLRVNKNDELVIQRNSLTAGKYPKKDMPVRLSYTFWNREKRLVTSETRR